MAKWTWNLKAELVYSERSWMWAREKTEVEAEL